MLKTFRSLLIFSILIFLIPHNTYSNESTERFIIGFTGEMDTHLIEKYDGEILYSFDTIQAVTVELPKSSLTNLEKYETIKYIEKDEIVTAQQQRIDWGVQKTNAPSVWQNDLTGAGVKIAILDTGIDRNHPDLRIRKGASFVSYTTNFQDDNGHGTHVAGIIAARNNNIGTVGMAPNADLYIAKILDKEGNGFQSDIIKGIEWAIKEKVDIINLSVGGTASRALESTLQKAYDQGILLVAAAGNKGDKGGAVEFPAGYPTVIAVGATNQQDFRAPFSAQGNEVEVSAPGTRIFSTFLNGGYEYSSGTSMAAPHVVGHLALLKEAHPKLSHKELRELLRQQTIDLGPPGRDSSFGFGRIELPSTLVKQVEPELIDVNFIDLEGSEWFAGSIIYLAERGMIGGYEDQTVRPLANITRAEATVILTRALQIEPVPYRNVYPDVGAQLFAAPAIQAAFNQNLISGFPDGSFRPRAFITRGEVAALLVRAYNIQPASQRNYFKDVNEPYFAAGAINALAEANLTSGYPDGTFKPQENISRAEFAAILTRIIQANGQ